MSGFAQEKITIEFDSELSQALHFFDQTHRIDDRTITDHADLVLTQNARGDEVENILLAFNVHCMTGVIAALRANNHVGFLGQDVDDFAFAFIAPLGAHQYRIGHRFNKNPRM